MRNRLYWCLVLLMVTACLPGWCADKAQKVTFQSAGKTRTFYFYAPNGGEPRPLIVLLHGSNRNGRVMTDMWEELAAKEQVILAAPDALHPETWQVETDGPTFIKQLIAEVNTRRAIDVSRIYLFGHSAGAEFALMLGLLESQYFSAVAIHAGGLQRENANFLEYAKRKIPVGIWIGDRDPLVPLEHAKQTQTILEERGSPVTVTVIKGHDHNYYNIAKRINREAWAFFTPRSVAQPLYEDYVLRSP